MNWRHLFAFVILAQPFVATGAGAQQAGCGTEAGGLGGFAAFGRDSAPQAAGDPYAYPEGVILSKSDRGPVHADAQGMTLYTVNSRILGFAGRSSSLEETWTPFAAPVDAKPTGYWAVMLGEAGPQWTYKGDPVFKFNGDKEPGALGGDAFDGFWQTAFFIPPAPEVATPGNVAPVWHAGQYLFADNQCRALFAPGDGCGDACEGTPFAAGLASQGVGDWTIIRESDRAQWAYQGRPVYISALSELEVPQGAAVLQPPEQWTFPDAQ